MSAIASTTVANATSVPTSTPTANQTEFGAEVSSCNNPTWYENYESDKGELAVCMVNRRTYDDIPMDANVTAMCCDAVGGRLWTNNFDTPEAKAEGCDGFPPVLNCLTNRSSDWLACNPKGMRHSTCIGVIRKKDSSAPTGVAALGRATLGVLVVLALAVVSQ